MAPNNKKVTCFVDPNILDSLFDLLTALRPNTGDSSQTTGNGEEKVGAMSSEPVDNTDLSAVLNHILQAVKVLTVEVSEIKQQGVGQEGGDGGAATRELGKQVREQGDELDECRQRSMKGNFILSSPTIPSKNVVTVMKTDDQLREDGETLVDHVRGLVKTKYDVVLPESDVQACHRLPNGTIILRLWNRRPGSAWSRMIDAIKSGLNKGYNLFANFHLTRKRNGLLYEIRQLKKSGKINKFYTDENG